MRLKSNLQPADAIHVIAGEDYRTDYAIQLYKQGYGKTLFFTGGWCETQGYHHGEHARCDLRHKAFLRLPSPMTIQALPAPI